MKKPTPAQLEVLKKMNVNICILEEYASGICLWIRLYDYKKHLFRASEHKINPKTLRCLKDNKLIALDLDKSVKPNFYYFITEKGKAAANDNKEA